MSSYSTFETRIAVRPDDIDMNGHVHNSKYLDYVLAARYDQMERCYGMSMDAFLQRGLTWFVKASYLEHKRALALGESVLVQTRIALIERRGVRVGFEMLREPDSKLAARGWLDYTMISMTSGRPQSIPDDIVKTYSV